MGDVTPPERTPAPEDGAAERLRGIAEREKKATPAPWFASQSIDPNEAAVYGPDGDAVAPEVLGSLAEDTTAQGTADFIANAREDVPFLLAHIASLTAALAASRAEVTTERRLNEQHQAALDQAERERDEARAALDEAIAYISPLADDVGASNPYTYANRKTAAFVLARLRAALARGE